MKIVTAWSAEQDTEMAIRQAYQQLLMQQENGAADVLFLYCSTRYDSAVLVKLLTEWAPNAKVCGGTSCLGVMTEAGFHSENGLGLALMSVSDPAGSYGVGAQLIEENPQQAASVAVQCAIDDAGRAGELPALVLLTAAPGCEEQLIQGIEAEIGTGIPIMGGSSADNAVEGHWRQFAGDKVFSNAVVVTVLFPSVEVSYAFHSGYMPMSYSGRATKAQGRTLYTIDHRPAAEVYNEWTQGTIAEVLPGGGNVLSRTSLHPLGRIVGSSGELPYYRLSHPDQVTAEGALTLFSEIHEGDLLKLMTGTRESLITRAGRVAQAALELEFASPKEISGAIVTYCAGCMLAVQEDMGRVVAGINKALGGKPFVGNFTFGEQGCFIGGENRHGNLMISAVVFGKG